MKKLLSIEDLIHVYKGNVENIALRGVNLQINENDFLVIVGKSGSGKTTLLNCISGMVRPTAGHIYYHDNDITQLADDNLIEYRRDNLGIVYQNLNLIAWLNVGENIEVPLIISGKDKDRRKERITELLEYFDISRYRKQYPSFLSGGEQQRVAVAVALANNPSIILADEPTGNLDFENAQKIYELFEQLNKEQDVMIMLATHDLEAQKYCKRVYDLTSYTEIKSST